MRIREVAKKSGLSAATIRHYDQLGLLGAVVRTASGYRDFDDRDVRVLIFLRKARQLGFTLQECGRLLELSAAPDRHSRSKVGQKRDLAAARLAAINAQIAELERMRRLVQLHLDNIETAEPDCPVSNNLGSPAVNRKARQ